MRLSSPVVSKTCSSQILSYSVRGVDIMVSGAFGANEGSSRYLCLMGRRGKGALAPAPACTANPPGALSCVCRRAGLIGSRVTHQPRIGACMSELNDIELARAVACPLYHPLDRRRRVRHPCRVAPGERAGGRWEGWPLFEAIEKPLLGASPMVDPACGGDRALDGLAPRSMGPIRRSNILVAWTPWR